jgi:hypothetical protein
MAIEGIRERRRGGVRAKLARFLFSIAKVLSRTNSPRFYSSYATFIRTEDVVDLELAKIILTGKADNPEFYTAVVRLAQEVGRLRREQVITRLALNDAGIIILTKEERTNLLLSIGLEG